MDEFYKNDKINEEDRRNIAFQATNAVREAVTLVTKRAQPLTYEHALAYIHDLDPSVYNGVIELLSHKNESDDVKYYKELAEAEGKTPEELIEKHIQKLQKLIKANDKNTQFKRRLGKLIAAREYFNPRKNSEHKILNHDFFLADRPYFGKALYQNDSYKDYKVAENQFLRLRMLHPDKPEAILGADLIYEQFDLLKDRVRFVHLQYKAWDRKVLYINDQRLTKQITKMDKHLCQAGYCLGKHGKRHTTLFRFPYCAGFLRPTSNKNNSDSKMISTGQHLPICELLKLKKKDNKITQENVKGKSLSHQMFEEGFGDNKLGSRWMKIEELDSFYQKAGLTFLSDTIRIHAQEVITATEEEIHQHKTKK